MSWEMLWVVAGASFEGFSSIFKLLKYGRLKRNFSAHDSYAHLGHVQRPHLLGIRADVAKEEIEQHAWGEYSLTDGGG
jgi:hypothetical protein